MRIKNLNRVITSVLLAGGLAATSSAQATIITSSFTNPFEVTEINQSGSLDLFDAALGTLNSVTLTLTGESISEAVLTNNASGNSTFGFDSVLNYFFDLSAVGLTPPSPVFVTNLASTGGFVTLSSGEVLDLGSNADSGSYSVTITGAGLGAFIGTGSFATTCNTISGSTFTGGGGNIANQQNTTAFCAGEIAYDYSESANSVSAPATALLFGAGLLGVAATRRSKKQN